MATVTTSTNQIKVTKMVTVMEEVTTISLNLSDYEAKTLVLALSNIGGEPEGPRGQLNNILNVLREVVGSPHCFNRIFDTSMHFLAGTTENDVNNAIKNRSHYV